MNTSKEKGALQVWEQTREVSQGGCRDASSNMGEPACGTALEQVGNDLLLE